MKRKNNTISKKIALFILASLLFWFMTKLSKEYESTIKYPVAYENLPKDKLLQEQPPENIEIYIKGSGFRILSAKLFPNKIKIDASNLTIQSHDKYFLLPAQQKLAIQRQLNTGISIDHFVNDSILFNLGTLKKKKLPIRLNKTITYETGYDINGQIELRPDSIIVAGPEAVLDTLSFIETEELMLKQVNASFEQKLLLKKIDNASNVNFETSEVTVFASIDKFTEATIKLPFTIVNLPENTVINTYPKELEVTYKVSLANFGKINPSSFVIECNYQMSFDNNLRYLIPKVTIKSKLVKNVKVSPNRIDFIIEK